MKKAYEYLDYRVMLADWYNHRKEQGSFSYQAWADLAGFGAKDFLYRIIQGQRNLSIEGAQKVAQSMELNSAECEYFIELVQFNQASDRTSRSEHWNKLEEIYKQRQYTNEAVRLNYQKYRLLAQWHHKAIHSIILANGYDGDAAALANKLHPPITESQARKSIELLQELGLIDADSATTGTTAEFTDKTDNLDRQASQEYYKSCYEIALAALDEFGTQEREVSSQVMSFSRDTYSKIVEKAKIFQDEIAALAEQDSSGDRSYMLNLNLIPLSK